MSGVIAQADEASSYYAVQIQNFSVLKNVGSRCEFAVFESGGFKWKLVLYPKGNKNKDVKQHISLYLTLADTVEPDGAVYATFRLYLLDQNNRNDLILTDTQEKERFFHQSKLEWGFDRFIHIGKFNDPSNGYLVKDNCVFGAEVVSVYKARISRKGESFSLTKEAPVSKQSWRMEKFSKLKQKRVNSEIFSAGGLDWKIQLYPKGTSHGEGTHLSLYLALADINAIVPGSKVYTEVMLRILDQAKDRHIIAKGNFWFSTSRPEHGWSRFTPLYYFHRSKNCLLIGDICYVETEVRVLGGVLPEIVNS